ncbi:hypothetical protein GBW32_15530 [Streptomyces tsukubensis]|nr:hypothetical protein GBW32_15530 [Streptomyces tsukubensis]
MTRWCALLFKALGEITNHTKPGLTVRELGDTHSGDGGISGSVWWGTVAAHHHNHRQENGPRQDSNPDEGLTK